MTGKREEGKKNKKKKEWEKKMEIFFGRMKGNVFLCKVIKD